MSEVEQAPRQPVPVYRVRQNRWRNYEHESTGFVFDRQTRAIFGRQQPDGTVSPLTEEERKVCDDMGFNYLDREQTAMLESPEPDEKGEPDPAPVASASTRRLLPTRVVPSNRAGPRSPLRLAPTPEPESDEEREHTPRHKVPEHVRQLILSMYRKLKEPSECPICYEDIGEADLLITDCGHLFHAACIARHREAREKAACPTCRVALG